MAKTQTYSIGKILDAQKVLRNLPTKEREKSRAEVVAFLKGDLRKAVKQGHSLKEIQAILAEQGISVSFSSLEAVLGQPGKNSARKKTNNPLAESLVTMPKSIQSGHEDRAALDAEGKPILSVSGEDESVERSIK